MNLLMTRLIHVARRRLADRRSFANVTSWLWDIYSRAAARGGLLGVPGRGRLVSVRARGHSLGVHLRLGSTDFNVFHEIFAEDEYGIAIRHAEKPSLIVDLGSNIGLSVVYWKSHFPSAHVIAVEADDGNADVGELNTKELGGVEWVRACVVARHRNVVLDRSEGEWAYKLRDAPVSDLHVLRTVTVPELLQSRPGMEVDLLKCDIEGAEKELFGENAGWIGRVRTIAAELHEGYGCADFMRDLQRIAPFSVVSERRQGPHCVVVAIRE